MTEEFVRGFNGDPTIDCLAIIGGVIFTCIVAWLIVRSK